MFAYTLRRVVAVIPVMLVVALIVFLLLRLAPGDPAAIIAGNAATTQDVAAIRARLGLDAPLATQFITWLRAVAVGDLGESFYFKRSVASLIGERAGPTCALALLTLLLAVVIAVPLGAWAAWRAGSWVDRAVMGFAVLGFSVPLFVLGYALIYLFAVQLRWFPVQGYQPLAAGVGGFLLRLVLPSLTLAVVYVALLARITRASVLDVLGQDFVRTARAKGLSAAAVLWKHAVRNAAVPIVTVVGLGLGMLVGGVVVTESVFALPGLGRLTVDAVLARDYPTVQGLILFFALAYVLVNLVIDLCYAWLDPRIRLAGDGR